MNAAHQFAGVTASRRAATGLERGARYFQGMSILLLAVVLTGFSRSFFLRPLFRVPPMAPHVYVHAFVMTAWFSLFAVQTTLIRVQRTDLHRRLGILGAVLALAVAALALWTTLGLPAHFKADPVPTTVNGISVPSLAVLIPTVWGNFGSVTLYCVFVATAIGLRHSPEPHKRLLLLASITMVGAAFGRYIGLLFMWRSTSSFPHVIFLLFVVVAAAEIALPLSLVVHDLRTRHRLHPATLWGVAAFAVVSLGCQFVIPATDFARAVVIGLE